MKQSNHCVVTSISGTMLEKIERIIKLTHINRSEVIRNALRDYLDKKLILEGVEK